MMPITASSFLPPMLDHGQPSETKVYTIYASTKVRLNKGTRQLRYMSTKVRVNKGQGWASVLFKRTFRSLRSFPFF